MEMAARVRHSMWGRGISKSTKNFLPFWAFPVADKVDKSAEI